MHLSLSVTIDFFRVFRANRYQVLYLAARTSDKGFLLPETLACEAVCCERLLVRLDIGYFIFNNSCYPYVFSWEVFGR